MVPNAQYRSTGLGSRNGFLLMAVWEDLKFVEDKAFRGIESRSSVQQTDIRDENARRQENQEVR